MGLEVICVGYGRTGTLSLRSALEKLGYPCHHMEEFFKNNKADPIPFIEAEAGKDVDWDIILKDYRATTDWPSARFWEQLVKRYPKAKVVLTVRDPESWYRSCTETIVHGTHQGLPSWVYPKRYQNISSMINKVVWQGEFENRFHDKAFAIQKFNNHIERVKQVVEPERLLVFRVQEGWEPLCKFLDLPIPGEPFPRVNDTASFQRKITVGKMFVVLRLVVMFGVPVMAAVIAGMYMRR